MAVQAVERIHCRVRIFQVLFVVEGEIKEQKKQKL